MTENNRPAAGQEWNADWYAEHARFVSDLGGPVVDLLAPRPGERILDLGCGDGALTKKLADLGVDVLGLDADPDFVRAAKSRGLDVVEGDAHALAFENEFDAVFSNAALHWMQAPERVLEGVARALKPGGRFVAEQGGYGNCAAIVVAMNAALEAKGHADRVKVPWDFPSPAAQSARLTRAGFDVAAIDLIPRPTPLKTGMAAWLKTFGGPFVDGLPPVEAEQIIADAVRRLEPNLRDSDGNWIADYVRLRFKAIWQS